MRRQIIVAKSFDQSPQRRGTSKNQIQISSCSISPKSINMLVFFYVRFVGGLPVQLIFWNFVENFFRTVVQEMQRSISLPILRVQQFLHKFVRNFLRRVAEHLQRGRLKNIVNDCADWVISSMKVSLFGKCISYLSCHQMNGLSNQHLNARQGGKLSGY